MGSSRVALRFMSSPPNSHASPESGEVLRLAAAIDDAAQVLLADPYDLDPMARLREAETQLDRHLMRTTGRGLHQTLTEILGPASRGLQLGREQTALCKLYEKRAPGDRASAMVEAKLLDIHRRVSPDSTVIPLTEDEIRKAMFNKLITPGEEKLCLRLAQDGVLQRQRFRPNVLPRSTSEVTEIRRGPGIRSRRL
jgi:hypothetical protein